MAALQCEICGGKLIGKPGGVFECDSCGMEYSTEWAKAKVQEIKGTVKIEGPVEVTGTVKVEGGASVESLLKRANTLLSDQKWEDAENYFNQVLEIDPENAKAFLGLAMVTGWSATQDSYALGYINGTADYENNNLQRAKQFAKGELKEWLETLELKRQEYQAERQRALEEARIRRANMEKASKLLAVGTSHIVGLQADGTAVAGGKGWNDVSGWTGIVEVAAGDGHTVGLRKDGTVVAEGKNRDGQGNVNGWTDITAVAAGYYHTVGLRKNGTVLATGVNKNGQCNVGGWTDIVAVVTGSFITIGLRKDGTIVATGAGGDGQCNVDGWRDIVAVAAGHHHTVGLKADGTVVSTDKEIQKEVDSWRDIVAVASGAYHTVGVKADGTVVAVGENKNGQCNVGGWTDIVAVAANQDIFHGYTVGLRKDGTVVTTDNKYDLSNWKLFNSIDTLEQERQEAKKEEPEELRRERLEREKRSIEAELPTLKGLFSGGKRRELEARLAKIEEELKRL